MDIVKVNDAMDTLNSLLNPNDFVNLQRQVGQAVIKFQEDKAETRYRDDLNSLGIDMETLMSMKMITLIAHSN